MDPKIVIAIVIVVVVLAVVAVLLVTRRRKSEHLKQKFGSEYDRLVHQHGDPQRAESVLAAREKRVSHFELRSLPPTERDGYAQQWAFVQKKFVDDPKGAVNEADRLVTEVMNARGYPMSEFNQRADDISVNYPDAVGNYRAAHDIVVRHGRGQASTEDLRKAMVHFRSLFDELLGKKGVAHKEVA
ncbi:MAG: putative secreted protein [Bryobacterales bacterium]|nr:putative secreted protein [Bryobacterales bacterium]